MEPDEVVGPDMVDSGVDYRNNRLPNVVYMVSVNQDEETLSYEGTDCRTVSGAVEGFIFFILAFTLPPNWFLLVN